MNVDKVERTIYKLLENRETGELKIIEATKPNMYKVDNSTWTVRSSSVNLSYIKKRLKKFSAHKCRECLHLREEDRVNLKTDKGECLDTSLFGGWGTYYINVPWVCTRYRKYTPKETNKQERQEEQETNNLTEKITCRMCANLHEEDRVDESSCMGRCMNCPVNVSWNTYNINVSWWCPNFRELEPRNTKEELTDSATALSGI